VTLGTTVVGSTIVGLLSIYVIILIGRLVFDYVFMFARDWQPSGVVLLLVEGIFTVTDPPLKLLRRVIPPLRIGGISLDLAFLVLFILVQILIQLASRF
jgi:YggT family protein